MNTKIVLEDGKQEFHGVPNLNGHAIVGADLGMADFHKNNRMILNPNPDIVSKITKRIAANDGYCPCRPKDDFTDTRCPCLKFLNSAECCCSLFVKADK